MAIAVFVTCLAEAFAPEVASAAAALVARSADADVVVEVGDGCCGQPAWNAGYPTEARALARRLIPRLMPYEVVVVPSGSCATMLLRYYPHLFPPGSAMAAQASALADKTQELSAFLAQRPPLPRDTAASTSGAAGADVPEPRHAVAASEPADASTVALAFHPSCHSLRGALVGDAGQRCLAAAGCAILPHTDAEECCGFGGLFAVKQAALSTAMADRKLDALVAAGATAVVAGELGCLLHLEGRARRRGLPLQFRHLAEVLAEAGRSGQDRHAPSPTVPPPEGGHRPDPAQARPKAPPSDPGRRSPGKGA